MADDTPTVEQARQAHFGAIENYAWARTSANFDAVAGTFDALIAAVRAEQKPETPPLEVSLEQMDVLYRQKHDMWAAAITRAENAEAALAAIRTKPKSS